MKMHKEWIPVWLKDPHEWRPAPRCPPSAWTMAKFASHRRVHLAIRRDRAIWRSSRPAIPRKGKEAFETRGCMACHSMGEGGEKQGGTFAANLSRVGEKDNYDYLVRWVHNPRQRTAALLPVRKERHHRSRLHARRPAVRFRSGTRQVPQRRPSIAWCMQMTPMPSLRLTEDEARDIASYLETRKHAGRHLRQRRLSWTIPA